MKTIVVAIDFSPATAPVLAEAATLARVHRGRLVLVHVVQPPIYLPEYGGMLETIIPIVHQTEKAGARFLIQWKKALHRRGLAVTTVQADGHPATEILQQARARRAALIVLGSHGHSAWLRPDGRQHGLRRPETGPVPRGRRSRPRPSPPVPRGLGAPGCPHPDSVLVASTQRTACRTSAVASVRPSFSLMWPRCTSTVFGLRCSCSAMSRVLLPWPISWKISNSRSVSFSIGEDEPRGRRLDRSSRIRAAMRGLT